MGGYSCDLDYGDVIDGKYEDRTGDAYYARFDEDGTLKTYYEGGFIGGSFSDDTGNAF